MLDRFVQSESLSWKTGVGSASFSAQLPCSTVVLILYMYDWSYVNLTLFGFFADFFLPNSFFMNFFPDEILFIFYIKCFSRELCSDIFFNNFFFVKSFPWWIFFNDIFLFLKSGIASLFLNRTQDILHIKSG